MQRWSAEAILLLSKVDDEGWLAQRYAVSVEFSFRNVEIYCHQRLQTPITETGGHGYVAAGDGGGICGRWRSWPLGRFTSVVLE